MKNQKILRLLFLLIISGYCFSAQSKELFKELQEYYKQSTFISANFRQEKKVKFISKPLVSLGKFQFANELGLVWDIEEPFFSRTLFLSAGVFKFTESGEMSQEKDRATLAIADVLKSLFSGQWKELSNKFNSEKMQIDEQGIWNVRLTATDYWVKKAVQSISLQGKDSIEKIIVLDANDNITKIVIIGISQQIKPLRNEQKKIFKIK